MQPSSIEPAVITLLKPRKLRGLIAIYDVLGFSSFCNDCADEEAAELVMTTIDLVPEGMTGLLSRGMGGGEETEESYELVSRLNWNVFSDTIITTLPESYAVSSSSLALFLMAGAAFNRLMFDRGLPLRGSIQFGDFILGNRCVGGKVVVQAMEQIKSLETACTAFSDESAQFIRAKLNDKDEVQNILLEMIPNVTVSCKSGLEKLAVLNWFLCQVANVANPKGENPEDCEAYVKTSFTAHGKKLDSIAQQKCDNTVTLFKSLIPPR